MAIKEKAEKTQDLKIEGELPMTQPISNESPFALDTTEEVEEVKEEVVAPEAPQMVALSDVQKMMMDLQEDFERKLNERLKEERKLTEGKRSVNESVDYTKELVDDYLAIPVTFFSYQSSYSFHGDMRRGKESLPPGGMVRFKNLIRSRRRNGSQIQVVSVSTVTVKSRELLDFLRSSPYFGILFHETINQALTVDALWAQKLIEANQQVQRMSDATIIQRCSQEQIPLSQDIQLMRKQLTEFVAKRAKAQFDSIQNGLSESVRKMTSNVDEGDGTERNYQIGKVNV